MSTSGYFQADEQLDHCRAALKCFRSSSIGRPLLIFSYTLAGYVCGIALVLVNVNRWTLVTGIFVTMHYAGQLFEIGHDAAHNSFAASWRVNKFIGRLSFLPSLHVFDLWRYWHNVIHHRFTNLRGRDFVWVPLSPGEYKEQSVVKRLFYRICRSKLGLGFGIYYLIEVWAKRLIFPASVHARKRKLNAWVDFATVVIFVGTLAGLSSINGFSGRQFFSNLTFILIVPFLYVAWMIGFVVFFNHTHPEVAWYENFDEWSFARAQIEETVHMAFRLFGYRIGPNEIMCHTAHHIDTLIPLYRLEEAQDQLNLMLADRVVSTEFSVRRCVDILARCKLYDYKRKCWLNFAGHVTAVSRAGPSSAKLNV